MLGDAGISPDSVRTRPKLAIKKRDGATFGRKSRSKVWLTQGIQLKVVWLQFWRIWMVEYQLMNQKVAFRGGSGHELNGDQQENLLGRTRP